MKIQKMQGNEALLQRPKTAFLSSRGTAAGLETAVNKWVGSLNPDADCVMCGGQSPIEKLAFRLLLECKIPTILMLAEAMPAVFDAEVGCALASGRLLVATHCDDNVHSVTARSAFDRNMLMLSLAQNTVIGHCSKGGNLERVLAGFDNVSYLLGNDLKTEKPTFAQLEYAGGGARRADKSAYEGFSRSLRTSKGVVYFDFNASGKDVFMKITQVFGCDSEAERREKIFLDRSELQAFCAAVDCLMSMEQSMDMVQTVPSVPSASGDIAIERVLDDASWAWKFTQRKDMKLMGTRINSLVIDHCNLAGFGKALGDMLGFWQG